MNCGRTWSLPSWATAGSFPVPWSTSGLMKCFMCCDFDRVYVNKSLATETVHLIQEITKLRGVFFRAMHVQRKGVKDTWCTFKFGKQLLRCFSGGHQEQILHDANGNPLLLLRFRGFHQSSKILLRASEHRVWSSSMAQLMN